MRLAAIIYFDPALRESAVELAAQLGVPSEDGTAQVGLKARAFQEFLTQRFPAEADACFLLLTTDRLELYVQDNGMRIHADFHGPTTSYRRKRGGGKGQSIAKAVGVRSGTALRVLDATAGLGGDAFVLASLGCEVTLLERVPEVRALLADGIARARTHALKAEPDLLKVLDRMQIEAADAIHYMTAVAPENRPDVVYLDPMFPERSKAALVKKEMRVFHRLVGADEDADQLLTGALACARYRVVVKRPRIAPALQGPPPSHVLEGKSNRYDVYARRRLPSVNSE